MRTVAELAHRAGRFAPRLAAVSGPRGPARSAPGRQARYHDMLRAAGFTTISITSTSDAGDGLHSTIIQAVKPGRRL
jgi:hypothetical protein